MRRRIHEESKKDIVGSDHTCVGTAKEFLGDFDTKGDQLISKDMGIAYTVSPEDDNKIEAIMVGGKGYF